MNSIDITNNSMPNGTQLKDNSLFISKGFIAGNWKNAASQKTFPVFEPSSGEVLHECADFTRSDFVEAIDSAYSGYLKFHTSTTAKERECMLRKWFDLIIENANDSAFS
jgi:succinate-semialdehyde dehydrogenase/glutarate-semialdehyde dehydrogenase